MKVKIFSFFTDTMSALIIFGGFVFFLSIVIFYYICWKIVQDRFIAIGLTILYLFSKSAYYTFFFLDDNLFQIPFLLIAYYLLVIKENRQILDYILSGLLLSIAASIHIQILPLFIIFFIYVLLTNKKYINFKFSLVFGFFSLSILFPIILFLKNFNLFNVVKVGSYTGWFYNASFSMYSAVKSFTDLLVWFKGWGRSLFLFHTPIYVQSHPATALFLLILVFIIVKYFNKFNRKLLFVNISLFVSGALFAFVFDWGSTERWVTVTPFSFFCFAQVLFLYKENNTFIKINRIISSLLIIGAFSYFLYLIIPNIDKKNKTLNTFASLPEESVLIAGYFDKFFISYFNPGPVAYLDNRNTIIIINNKIANKRLSNDKDLGAFINNGGTVFVNAEILNDLKTIDFYKNKKYILYSETLYQVKSN